jgi:phosphatidylinositol alpha-1,6-mannosyltransferase
MNILLITQNFLPVIGGVEIHARQIAQEMSKAHRVSVAAMNFVASPKQPRLAMLQTNLLAPKFASYTDGPVAVHSLVPSAWDRLRMVPIAVRAIPKLQRYFYHGLNRFGYLAYKPVIAKKIRPLLDGVDIVHSLAGGYLGWTAQAVAKEREIPFVCTPFVHPQQWGDGPEDVEYYQRADGVIGLVDSDRDYLASIGVDRTRLHVIGVSPELPATVDPVAFRKKYDLVGKPVVLYVGRMMAAKGAAAVLAAAAKVWERHPEARFVFIGPASEDEAKQFEKIDPRIRYLGKVSTQEKADALSACDVFAMPSMSEILPTVYLEAWTYGKPVVGGKAHGLTELVEGNNAGLNVSQEPANVADAISRLLADPALRSQLGSAGRTLVQQRYSVEAVTRSLVALYQSVNRTQVPSPSPPELAAVVGQRVSV